MIFYTEEQAVNDYVMYIFINRRARINLYRKTGSNRILNAILARAKTLTDRIFDMRVYPEIREETIEQFDRLAAEYSCAAKEEAEKDKPDLNRLEEIVDRAINLRDELFSGT